MTTWCTTTDDRTILHVRVVPGARTSEVVGVTDDELKVRVAAPAHEGKANKELVRFLAKALGVPRSAVSIDRGGSSRHKVLSVRGVALDPDRLLPR